MQYGCVLGMGSHVHVAMYSGTGGGGNILQEEGLRTDFRACKEGPHANWNAPRKL